MAIYFCHICNESARAGEEHVCTNTKGAVTKYRKKPVEVEAIQWNGNNYIAVLMWMGGLHFGENSKLLIPTLEGTMAADLGDYIIKGIKGEFYPCKPDIFEATYDVVEEKERTN